MQTRESEFPDVLRPVQHLLQEDESREDAAALLPVQAASLLRALQAVGSREAGPQDALHLLQLRARDLRAGTEAPRVFAQELAACE